MSTTEFGLLQLIYYWVVMATEVPSGVVADRIGRKWALFLGALVNGAGCYVFAVSHDFSTFAIGEVLFALGTALISGADSALLYDSFAAERRESEYPRAEAAGQMSWLVVTAVALPLTDRFLLRGDNPVLAYWVTGSLSFAGAACALAMVEPLRERRLSTREITLGAMRDVVRIPGVLRLICYSVGVFILLRLAIVNFFNPALETAGVPVNFYGTVLAVVNVVGAIAAWKAYPLMARYGERAFLVAMPVGLMAMYALLLAARTPAAAALFCIQGAVFGAYPLVVRTMLNRLMASGARRATTLSIESMACRIIFGMVTVFAGWALGHWGHSVAIGVTALLGCAPFLLVPLFRRARVTGS